MNKGLQIFALMFALVCAASAESTARQALKQTLPEYPAILKKLKIGGTVKLNAVVAADGTVKKTKIDGGNPVLAEVACNAVKKWKFETASAETTGIVEFKFDPNAGQ